MRNLAKWLAVATLALGVFIVCAEDLPPHRMILGSRVLEIPPPKPQIFPSTL